ncbi:MAG: pyruvate formate lyase family protein, partial [Thermodesulfobacteriota bacterium]
MAIHPANQRIKDRLLTAPYSICIERARWFTRSHKAARDLPPALQAARALSDTLSHMTLWLDPDELIAGNRTSKPLGVVIPVERGDVNLILSRDLDQLCSRESQPFHISPADRRELLSEILPYWRGKTVRDRKKKLYRQNDLNFFFSLNPLAHLQNRKSLDLKRLGRTTHVPGASLPYKVTGVLEVLHNNPAMVMNVFDVQGHLILGHRNILREGFSGVRKRAAKRLARANSLGDREGEDFLSAVILCCDAVRAFGKRLARLAREQARTQADPERRKELLDVARHCDRVPFHPPRTFAEAVQALWLTQVAATIAHGMAGILAIGRFDQYLYPFYEKDLRDGLITPDQALRLLEELLIKLGTNLMVLPYAAKKTANELGSDSAAPTVGGLDPDGKDAVNELSHLILTAFANVKSLGNSFTIRLSEKSPEPFWDHALATFRETSGAALFSDEAAVPALISSGMKPADARDYGVIGCVEPAGDGNSFPCTSGNDISLAAAMEMTLLNGRLRIMAKRIVPKTGDPRRFRSFDELFSAFKRQVRFQIETVARAVNLKDRVYRESFPCPFVSATL